MDQGGKNEVFDLINSEIKNLIIEKKYQDKNDDKNMSNFRDDNNVENVSSEVSIIIKHLLVHCSIYSLISCRQAQVALTFKTRDSAISTRNDRITFTGY